MSSFNSDANFLTSHLWQKVVHLSPYTWPPSSPADAGYLQKNTHLDAHKNCNTETQFLLWDECEQMSIKTLTADSTDDQNLLRAAVSHGSFCDLHQHSEHSLLSITRYFSHFSWSQINVSYWKRSEHRFKYILVERNTNPQVYIDLYSTFCEQRPACERNY